MTALDLIQDLIGVVRTEQDIRADLQHELAVMKREIADLRLRVFEAKPVGIVMPRLESAMKAKEN